MLSSNNSNLERTVFIKNNTKTRRLSSQTTVFPLQPIKTTCMICMRSAIQASAQLIHKFCSNCISKLICSHCIQQITSMSCPFCHTNNKVWRKTKREILFNQVERRIEEKRRFWWGLKIKQKNVHMQYAIKNGIQQYIHVLDGLVQKLTEDIKFLVKLDFQKQQQQNQKDVILQIEDINVMQQTYDRMMIDLKNEFGVQLSTQ